MQRLVSSRGFQLGGRVTVDSDHCLGILGRVLLRMVWLLDGNFFFSVAVHLLDRVRRSQSIPF